MKMFDGSSSDVCRRERAATAQVTGDGTAPVAPDVAAGLGLWFAVEPALTPTTADAARAPPEIHDDTDAPPPPLDAVGVVFFADGARVAGAAWKSHFASWKPGPAFLRLETTWSSLFALENHLVQPFCA